MTRDLDDLIAEVTTRHLMGDEVDVSEFVAACGEDNDAIADLIDADAQGRLARGLPLTVDTYLEAVPDIRTRPEVLDAVIEHALRAIGRTHGLSGDAAIDRLRRDYPALERQIEVAGLLNEMLWSTRSIKSNLGIGKEIVAPCDIGPKLDDGRARFELRRELGRGAHGVVFEAIDRQLSDKGQPAWVAIKIMRGPREDNDQLAHEARTARRVDHQNVVRVLDLHHTSYGDPFVVYELVDGGSLMEMPDRESVGISPRRAAELVSQVARGVQAAHRAGLVHGDIKPGNILIGRDGAPKVSDFGIASIRSDESASDAKQRGSLGFMAPEQYHDRDDGNDVTVDVYGLGGVLFWLLTGLPPNGATKAEVERRFQGISVPTTSPASVGRPIDEDLDAICARSLHPDPRDRYQSADALALDLDAWLAYKPLAWRRPNAGRRLRLFAERDPVVLVWIVTTVMALVAASAALVFFAKQGESATYQVVQSRLEADRARLETERSRLELALAGAGEREAQARLEEAGKIVRGVLETLDIDQGELSRDWLPIVTVLESMVGPLVSGQLDDGSPVWTLRILVVEDMLREADEVGVGSDIDSAQWRMVLAYWLFRDDQLARSAEEIARTRADWIAAGWPTEPWLDYLDMMQAACDVADEMSDISTADLESVAAAARVLERETGVFVGPRQGSYLHLLTMRALERAYLPDLLDEPGKLEALRSHIAAVKARTRELSRPKDKEGL